MNIVVSYASFYNPINLLLALPRLDRVWADRVMFQLLGMIGLAKSICQSRKWFTRLIVGPIEKVTELPQSRFPVVSPNDLPMAHEPILGNRKCMLTAGSP
jgi:hypothetical protein